MGKMLSDPLAAEHAAVSFDDELLILVDENDNVTGYDEKLNVHLGQGKLHRAFSIFLFSPCGQVLLQRRSGQKPLWPLYWSNSVCSHPRKGEEIDAAALRRLREELGISTELEYLYRFCYSAQFESVGTENELCNVYAGCVPIDCPVVANENEIDEWAWVEIDEFERRIAAQPEQFTPWMLLEWQRMQKEHASDIRRLIDAGRH